MKTKIAIGCLIQWYECNIIDKYIETLKEALEQYNSEVLVDVTISTNQDLEKCISKVQLEECVDKIYRSFKSYNPKDNWSFNQTSDLITIADYRRQFNEYYCDKVDVLVWGESDMLVPKQMFKIIDALHQAQSGTTPKYLATFATCKMWDSSWKPLEHIEFTGKPFIDNDTQNWWSVRYNMSKEEMNQFNDKVQELELTTISPHKYNGCGLVISSEVIKAGVSIPRSVFFVHEDTAFMLMTQKLLPNIPQYHFRNVLLVHNRKSPHKRAYIQGEQGIDPTNIGALRKAHLWYSKANSMCEQNCYNIFNANYKSKTWQDVWNEEG